MPLSNLWKRAFEAVKNSKPFRAVKKVQTFLDARKVFSTEELQELVREKLLKSVNRRTLTEPVAAESIFGEEYHDEELDAILRLVPQPLQRRAQVQDSPSLHSERASIEEEPFCISPTAPLPPLPLSHLELHLHLQSRPPSHQTYPRYQPPSSLQTRPPPRQTPIPQSRSPSRLQGGPSSRETTNSQSHPSSRLQTSPPPRQTIHPPERTMPDNNSSSWRRRSSSLRRHLSRRVRSRTSSSSSDKSLPSLPSQPIPTLDEMKGPMRRWAVRFDAEQVATSLWAQEIEEMYEKRAEDVAGGREFDTPLARLEFRSRDLEPELDGLAAGLRPRASTFGPLSNLDLGPPELSFAQRMESPLERPGTATSNATQRSGLRRVNAARNLRGRFFKLERRGTD
ncbi:hypothetical protein VTL71DRAFT_421 [Oculimacula yallundae]|uniref:Uncharacterized protein n=1 Tax=Oculimacula yallundae TaxID=86028 RepID=A0ABR4D017_9HELO